MLGTCDLMTLRQRTSFKWRTYPADVLPAFVAEMDFDLAAPVKQAVTAAMAAGDCGYGHRGVLGEAFASFAAGRLGWVPDPAQVFPIPDVMTGLAEVISAITPPGSGIVINPPVYPPFWFRFGFSGRRIIEAPLARAADGSYDLDPAAVDAALSEPGAAAYLLCSPHNPTGNVWSADQLLTVADLCQRHGAALLVDEIHAPLALPGARFVPFLTLDHEISERVFTFTSASKGWNVPGLKCGLAVAGSEAGGKLLAERWEALLPGQLGVLASAAAFTDGLPWLDALIAQLDENRALLTRLLAEHLPQVGYSPPRASFLAWLDCRELGLGDDPAAAFLARGRVALSPGPDFGPAGRGFARLNLGTSPDLVAEAVRRMTAAVAVG
ncbi:MAG: aminotransferase class I/II-fold pyridoxal phosphate-dependent enzyme [Actinobacteria bacterium]|nr:aminotransferase class I/II-fold pyridoxal phosphate-dependent enzyme [Actinomycetota bacterium]MBO0788940.1 aminotransferase class I/II-fold pyridoxal phosphate-dependent enzyme [Actinomycetota bacterium]